MSNLDSKFDIFGRPLIKHAIDWLSAIARKKAIRSRSCALIEWPYNRNGLQYAVYISCWITGENKYIKTNARVSICIGN